VVVEERRQQETPNEKEADDEEQFDKRRNGCGDQVSKSVKGVSEQSGQNFLGSKEERMTEWRIEEKRSLTKVNRVRQEFFSFQIGCELGLRSDIECPRCHEGCDTLSPEPDRAAPPEGLVSSSGEVTVLSFLTKAVDGACHSLPARRVFPFPADGT
jgi:hypothetical protein